LNYGICSHALSKPPKLLQTERNPEVPTPEEESAAPTSASKDTGEALDIPTTEDWAVLVSAFVAEWMELDEHLSNAHFTSNQTMARRAARDELS